MSNKTNSHSGLISRVRHVWAEMDYAQRRLFEIRTGVPVSGRDQRR
jgi:hypothetical protein